MDATRKKGFSVVMLPWLAHGHISPFLELSKKLADRNIHIYFCSTPVNLNSIKLSPKHSLSIQLVELHLPSFPELPPHYHTTKGLPPHLMNTLKRAFEMASPGFSSLLKKLNPDLVIYDFLQPWAPAVAMTHNIPAVHFLVTSAVTGSFFFHIITNPDYQFPFSSIFFHDYMKSKLNNVLESSSNGIKDKERFFLCFEYSFDNIILVKTIKELEGKYIDYLSILMKKKIVPVGPLVQDTTEDREDDHEMEIIKWLDKKERSSTLFVSFGSEYFLSKEEREEIAHGLELSQVNFIWVLRFPRGEKIKLKQALPLGFLERTKERGKIVKNWAPQAKILGHSSTGGFVSHCGWSSVMESMKFGVPIVATPMHLDQPINARLVEDVGVGLEVIRNENGRFEREEFARVIREVVGEKSGEKIRRKAREMSEIIREKGDEEIDNVVNELLQIFVQKE